MVPAFDPFFNALTGLNGSGKSNVLDAICFVLGITNLSQARRGGAQAALVGRAATWARLALASSLRPLSRWRDYWAGPTSPPLLGSAALGAAPRPWFSQHEELSRAVPPF